MDSRNIEKYEFKNDNYIDTLLQKHCMHLRTGYVQVGPDKFLLSSGYEKFATEINNFEIYSNDIWVTGYPKTGTNWLQEIVWCIANNLDFKRANSKYLNERFPSFEASMIGDSSKVKSSHLLKLKYFENSVEYSKNMERPRFIKTHLPYSLLPQEIYTRHPKIIYITRNVKDIVPSYYNHLKIFEQFDGSINDLADLFMNDRLQYTPFFRHVHEFWQASKTNTNILFLRYEDMKLNMVETIRKIATFLDKQLNDNDIAQLMEHTSLENMKKNPALNRKFITGNDHDFIRSGKVGGYKEDLSNEMIERLDEWIRKSISGTDMQFLL